MCACTFLSLKLVNTYLKQTTIHMATMTAMIIINRTATAAPTAIAGPPSSPARTSPCNVTAEQTNSSRCHYLTYINSGTTAVLKFGHSH